MTKYEEIVGEIKKGILDGTWKAGYKLPSVRQLSNQFSCSKNTIIMAYKTLEQEHLIYAKPKSGYYVVNALPTKHRKPLHIDFLSAGPDKEIMPYIEIQHCLNQAIDTYQSQLFTYSDLQGFESLRTLLSKQLQSQQVFTIPKRIFVLSGAQQAINILVSIPFPNKKKNILLEQPTYFGIIDSINLQNETAFGVEVTMNGIDLEKLEYIFRNHQIKFFYIISRFHNPLGHSYTNEEKKKIVQLAQKYDVYIVEDDYLGELDPHPKNDPIFSFDPSGRVIYIKSFSKIMLPGLRMAIAILPETMTTHFLRHKFTSDFNSSALSQGALEIYIKSGMYNEHMKRIKEKYQHKMEKFHKACELHLPSNISYTKPKSGFFSSLHLPAGINSKDVAALLSQNNVYVDDAVRMFLPEFERNNIIRISISQVEEEQIEEGVKIIAESIEQLMSKPSFNRCPPIPLI